MAWARLDDRFHENRKVRRVWRRCPAAIGLHVMAITYCAGHMTDGLVDEDFVEDRMPSKRERERAIGELVAAGLWHEADDGWEIHDFAEFNVTRAQAQEEREAKAEAGRKGAAKRWGSSRAVAPPITPAKGGASGQLNQVPDPQNGSEPEPVPNPSLPDIPPDPPRGGRHRDREKWREEFSTWVSAHPPSLLADDWEVPRLKLAEVVGQPNHDMYELSLLHPHALSGGVWVLGGPDHVRQALSFQAARPGFKKAVGFEWHLIGCDCALSSEQAA